MIIKNNRFAIFDASIATKKTEQFQVITENPNGIIKTWGIFTQEELNQLSLAEIYNLLITAQAAFINSSGTKNGGFF